MFSRKKCGMRGLEISSMGPTSSDHGMNRKRSFIERSLRCCQFGTPLINFKGG
jgi:hypothetical protein